MWSPVGGAESPKGDGWYACPAGGYFSVMKSRQKNFGAEFVIAFGGAEILQGAKPVRLPGGGLLFYEEK